MAGSRKASEHVERAPRTALSFDARAVKAALVAAVILAVVLVYLPGLHGPFVLDDGENITLNPAVALTTLDVHALADAALSNESGLFKRPIAALSFALSHYFAGGFDSTFGFKATNL